MRQSTFINNKPILFIVATPIGNLDDITLRAINTLKNVSLIACEDTRETKKILNHYNINNTLISYHQHNEKKSSQKILTTLKNGGDVALVSDAGLPLISDPGSIIVDLVINNGFNVSVIPGPSSLLTALVASNIDTSSFSFLGFLDFKKGKQLKQLENLKKRSDTLVFFESPNRLNDTLKNMLAVLGDRNICIGRELTKKFEEFIRGKISNILSILQENLKGELVLIVEGQKQKKEIDYESLNKKIIELKRENKSTKDIINYINDLHSYNIPKNDLYNLIISLEEGDSHE